MEFTITETINRDADTVWRALAHEFDRVAEWNSEVTTSAPAHDLPAPQGANAGGRVCQVGVGEMDIRFAGAGRLAGPFAGRQMRRIVAKSLGDVKTYVETGKVSARKQKQLAKAAR